MFSDFSQLWQNLNGVDAILGLWLLLAALHGFSAGLIRMIGNVVGLVAGLVVAGWYYQGLAAWGVGYLPDFLKGFGNWIEVIAFIVITIVFAKVAGLIFEGLNSLFNVIAIIPGLSFVNRLGGLVVSVIEAALTIIIILFTLSRYPILEGYRAVTAQSVIVQKLQTVAPAIEPLFPSALLAMPGLFDVKNPFVSE